ncbi:MAG: biotin--[acetyl-CoA-carboxylase] ligase [Clostridia bacterium]|nr:biotin--[acetyl-CoA-carboxylase] ligase [Clostridia bacterium]
MKTVILDSVDSTNLYAKRFSEDVIVIAREQTAGRGTKDRSFSSERGGLYLTKVVHKKQFGAEELFRVMTDATVAVCKTVEYFGANPFIKWPNDVLTGGKKLCGILIENTVSGNAITRSLVGIGLNINNSLPEELRTIATTLSEATGRKQDVDEVQARLIENLQKNYPLETYREYLGFLSQKVRLILPDEIKEGVAVDVDGQGRLLLRENGVVTAYAAGEVSLRL